MKYVLELGGYRTPTPANSKSKKSINRSERNSGRDVKVGTTITAVSEAVAQALVLAYAAPFSTVVTRKPDSDPEDDLGGRDPNW